MKRIVVCSDGTWQKPDQPDPSHVADMNRAVLPTAPDGIEQVVFYDAGVGAEEDRVAGGITGKGLEKNVQDCYRFLVHNYEDGDEIYLFGFSRGAYTVRSLAGMVRNCGVLKKSEAARIPEAFDLYRRADAAPCSAEAGLFRVQYSLTTKIWFIGVWDTVGSLGIPWRGFKKTMLGFWDTVRSLGVRPRGLERWPSQRHRFHDTELSRCVKRGYHALAIDERRVSFQPSLWRAKPKDEQVVEQVWFAGEHGDIGGTSATPLLANPSFDWMRERASEAGLALDETFEPTIKVTGAGGWLGTLKNLAGAGWNRIGLGARKIGGETQFVHPSALERYEGKRGGAPRNLKRYLKNPNRRIYGEGKER